MLKRCLFGLMSAMLLAGGSGCASFRYARWSSIRPPDTPQHTATVTATAYCPCGACCNWERSWLRLGKPVIASGPNEGKPKAVGVTASGAPAKRGTIAADTRVYPFGTVMQIPGYGYGVVEDRGGDIKGQTIDLFYPTHDEALDWGRVKVTIKYWLPERSKP